MVEDRLAASLLSSVRHISLSTIPNILYMYTVYTVILYITNTLTSPDTHQMFFFSSHSLYQTLLQCNTQECIEQWKHGIVYQHVTQATSRTGFKKTSNGASERLIWLFCSCLVPTVPCYHSLLAVWSWCLNLLSIVHVCFVAFVLIVLCY